MPLLSLPNEVLTLIIRQSVPASFEGLVLSCKLLYSLGTPFLEDQKFLRQFRHFSYGKVLQGIHGQPIEAGWELLATIAEDPRIAHVIEVADLRRPTHSLISVSMPSRKARWGAEKVCEGILGLLRADPEAWTATMLDEKDMLNLLFGDYEEIYKGTAETFLLTLLPNVEVLVASYTWMNNFMDWRDTREAAIVPMANTLCRRANSVPRQTNALSRLRELVPQATAGSRNQVCVLNSFQPLLALPSLEIAKVAACVWKDSELESGEGGEKMEFDVYPGLKQLEISCSPLWREKLLEILTRMPRLEILTLDYERDDNTVKKIGWDIGRIVDVLGQTAGKHLKALHIRTPDWPERIGSQPKDFRSFTALEELEIDLNVLHPQTIGGMLYSPELTADEMAGTTTVMPPFAPLTDVLPHGLRRLRLRVRVTSPHRFDSEWFPGMLRSLFGGFSARSTGILPKLEVVELWQTEATRPLKGFERQMEDLRVAVRQISEENPQVQFVTQPGFKSMSLERRWLV